MKKTIEDIKNDIKNGENIDIYLSILLAVVVAVLGIIGVASFSILSAAILMLLSLLAGSILMIRKSANDARGASLEMATKLNDLQSALSSLRHTSVSDIFRRGYPNLQKDFDNTSSISVLGTNLVSTINSYYGIFEKAIDGGCKLRIIISSTESGVLGMLKFCNYKADDIDALRSMIQYHTKRILALGTSGHGGAEVRALSYVPPYGIIVAKKKDGGGKIYVKLMSFRTLPGQYPTMEIGQEDVEWFHFFDEQFEKFWEAAKPANRTNEFSVTDTKPTP
jgi:hypothetical protein